jgi:Autophagy protein Apg5
LRPHQGWFSFENVPLKWHHPVGLLFDLYSGAKDRLVDENGAKDASASQEEESVLPWKLVLHFSGWPNDQIITLDAEGKVLQDMFYNSVKEVRWAAWLAQALNDTGQLRSTWNGEGDYVAWQGAIDTAVGGRREWYVAAVVAH